MTELELTLSRALNALPMHRATAGTIGGRLGVSAQGAGVHLQRIRRRQYVDGQGQTNAADLIKRLPRTGEALHFILDGSFRLSDVIPVIQDLARVPCNLTVCTLGLNDDTIDLLAAMLKAGTLTNLRLAMSSYFKASDPLTAARAVEVLTQAGAALAVSRVHAKLQLWHPATGRARYVLETSSNLRSCNCVEVATLANSPGLYNWHDRWLTRFFDQNAL